MPPSIPIHAQHRLPIVLGAAALVRLALFAVPRLSNTLEKRPELTSPATSFRSLKEGVWLYTNGFEPYAGGVFYHSPLYLLFFTYLIRASSTLLNALLWTLADTVGAVMLVDTWRSRQVSQQKGYSGRDYVVALLYLFNPYTLLSCLARSTTTLDNALVLTAIAGAFTGNTIQCMAALALATQTSLYPALLMLPLLCILRAGAPPKVAPKSVSDLVVSMTHFVTVSAFAFSLACVAFDLDWVDRSWGLILKVTDLTPNVGMWWYFFTEMFDHFRTFFGGVFQLHTVVYVLPLCLRLSDPGLALLTQVGVISTWKSYPTLGDMALWAGLLGCFPEIVRDLSHPLFSLTVHLYTCILLPLLHSLWLLTGTGNANFFYAATMVYGLNSTLAIADVLGTGIKLDVKQRLQGVFYPGLKDEDGGAGVVDAGCTGKENTADESENTVQPAVDDSESGSEYYGTDSEREDTGGSGRSKAPTPITAYLPDIDPLMGDIEIVQLASLE